MIHRRTTNRRAFTLIEVLIATIILGLGVLGLSALFAGAATQQQAAAAVSRSVAFTQSGVGLMGDKLSGIVNAGGDASVPDGVWDALVSKEAAVGAGGTRISTALRSSFASFPLSSSDQFGFTTPSRGGAILGQDRLAPPTASLPNTPLRHDRIWLKNGFSILIDFYTGVFGQGQSVTYALATQPVASGGDPDPQLRNFLNDTGPAPAQVSLWRNGQYRNPAAPGDFLTLTTGFGGAAASVSGQYFVPDPPAGNSRWRNSVIRANPYTWFDDLLVSVNDRTAYIDSDTVPGGRQPVMSYHALYREANGQAEVAVITYSLRSLGAPRNKDDELPYIPPDTREDFRNEEAVLREVEVTLGQDPTTGQYYVVPLDDKDAWIASTGQILIMSSRNGASAAPVGAGATPDPGADSPVQVLTVRTVGGERRAILEDSPRIGSRSVLDPTQGSTVNIHVWAVAPLVESQTSDRTQWQLTPVEVSTFKLVL